MVAGKAVVAGLSAVSLVTLLSGLGYHFKPYFTGEDDAELEAEANQGAIAGRIVSIPAKTYQVEFGVGPMQLGDCPSVKDGGRTVTCQSKFTGAKIFIPHGKTTVDVTKVETTEDILNHVMGGVGVTVGALGLFSVTPKVKVAVTTKTTSKTLNLISSYEVNLGAETLQHPRVQTFSGSSALYLSEIEYGGSEAFMVTLEFTSEDKKTEVEVSVTIKILWWSISVTVRHVTKTSSSSVGCRVQLISSWRENVDRNFDTTQACLETVERLEADYMEGPSKLRSKQKDESLQYFYYFASWKQNPYGAQANQAVINHDLETLTEQTTELEALMKRIETMRVTPDIKQLSTTIAEMLVKLTDALKTYHKKTPDQRRVLLTIYGSHAPQYYTRQLARFAKEAGE